MEVRGKDGRRERESWRKKGERKGGLGGEREGVHLTGLTEV